jgi:SAM-dependent methyltransferase
MASLENILIKHRKELLQQTHGVVLEVGAGTGVNFDLYPDDVEVFAIEPSKPMFQKALKKVENHPNIHLYNIGIEAVLNHQEIPKQFDFITSMLVLCTIKNPVEAINLYQKLLKPEGQLLVLEHIHSTGKSYGTLQKFVNPVWRPLADGCNLTRRQDVLLKQAGFKPLTESYFTLGTDWYQAVMIKQAKDDTL